MDIKLHNRNVCDKSFRTNRMYVYDFNMLGQTNKAYHVQEHVANSVDALCRGKMQSERQGAP